MSPRSHACSWFHSYNVFLRHQQTIHNFVLNCSLIDWILSLPVLPIQRWKNTYSYSIQSHISIFLLESRIHHAHTLMDYMLKLLYNCLVRVIGISSWLREKELNTSKKPNCTKNVTKSKVSVFWSEYLWNHIRFNIRIIKIVGRFQFIWLLLLCCCDYFLSANINIHRNEINRAKKKFVRGVSFI